jgi:hypothetical protein
VSGIKRDATSGIISSISAQASGSVLWDREQAGSIGNSGDQYVVAWNDGSSVPFGLPVVAPWL